MKKLMQLCDVNFYARAAALTVACTIGLTSFGQANAEVVVVGSTTGYASTDKDWQTNTTNDIDGNGLGTDGYIFFGNFDGVGGNNNPDNDQNENIFGTNALPATDITTSQPTYISTAATGADSLNIGQFANYEQIDNPLAAVAGTDGVAGNLLVIGTGASALEFTVAGLAADTTVRVGVLGAVLNDDARARFDAPVIGLTDGTDFETVTGLPNLSDGTAGASLGWVFFDIDADGDYVISVPPDAAGIDPDVTGFGGVTFDSISTAVVPEPSSLALLGFGGLGMLIRRRK